MFANPIKVPGGPNVTQVCIRFTNFVQESMKNTGSQITTRHIQDLTTSQNDFRNAQMTNFHNCLLIYDYLHFWKIKFKKIVCCSRRLNHIEHAKKYVFKSKPDNFGQPT